MDIKAIETVYNGYKFRSRLEARWAVFFDEMKIEYEYELEGYKLPSGLCYLPDFRLPELGVFVEVKPSFEAITDDDIKKMLMFSSEKSIQLLLIVGTPTKQKMSIMNNGDYAEELEYIHENLIGENLNEKFKIYLEDNAVNIKIDSISRKYVLIDDAESTGGHLAKRRFDKALLMAKQARFEFGKGIQNKETSF